MVLLKKSATMRRLLGVTVLVTMLGSAVAQAAELTEPPGHGEQPPQSLREMVEGLDQTGTPPLPPEDDAPPPNSAPPGEERPVPNYDGRDPPPPDAADVAIWIPRILFYPVHLFFEYALRWPLLKLSGFVESHSVVQRVQDWLTWDDGNAGVFPRFFIDFGFRPHVGASFFWRELGPDNNVDLAADLTAWDDLLAARAAVSTRIFRDDSGQITLRGGYVVRPDYLYLGQEPTDVCRLLKGCRYRGAQGEAEVLARLFLPELNMIWAGVAYRSLEFSPNTDDFPPIPISVAQELPGFVGGYSLIDLQVGAQLDSRSPDIDFEPGSGVRLELIGHFAVDPANTALRFFRYGGEASGFWDVGHRHVLSARFYTELIENVSDRVDGGPRVRVPFTELVVLGGNELMRGFLWGHLRGRHAYVATLQYRWPVWWRLDASIFVSMGTALPSFLEWDIGKNYLNYGLAFRAPVARDVSFDMILALGTNRFDEVDLDPIYSGRLALGINYGF